MAGKRRKKSRRNKKSKKTKKYYRLVFSAILTVVFFSLLFFIFWWVSTVPEHEIYLSSENPEQGDTISIKASGEYPLVSGSFNNEDIVFFRNGIHSNWIAFLGIDVSTVPGKHKIIVSASGEKMEKEISVELKDFPSVGMVITKELENKGFTAEKVAENIAKKDNPTLNQILEKFTPNPYFEGSFSFPLSNVQISGLDFGEFIKSKDYQVQHLGVDLRAVPGTKVYAVNDGKIVLIKELANYGKTVVIDHGLGIFSLYLHLDEYMVPEDQYVKKDQVIGLSGNSGYSTSPHLHFSIRNNKAKINPLLFIETTQEADQNLNLANIGKAFLKIINFKK